MNRDDYSNQLKKAAVRGTLMELLIYYLMGMVGLGIWLLGILDPLPMSVYGPDMNPESKSFVKLLFWGFGAFGFLLLGLSVWATIALWHRRRQPDATDDDLV